MSNLLESIINNSLLDEDKSRLNSRVHPLRGFDADVYVKREDELSFGISGSKLRKLLGIKKEVLRLGAKKIHIIGGLNSNHLLSSLQMVRELGLEFEVHCLEQHSKQMRGNRFLCEMLLGSDAKLNFVPREQWKTLQSDLEDKFKDDPSSYVIAEGAYQVDALFSAMTIFKEIAVWHENQTDKDELHVWVDSGTGLLCQALELANAAFGSVFRIHPILIAGSEEDYDVGMARWLNHLEKLGIELTPKQRLFHRPDVAKSFGATNKSVFVEIINQARINGMLIDPLYAAKSLKIVAEKSPKLNGKHLWIHGGGALSVFGFQEKISKYL